MPVSAARRVAFEVMRKVEAGGFASDLLRAETGLSTADAGLATELVLGCLRRQSQLDYLTRHFGARDPDRLDLEVRIALRLGMYQLRYLDRIPPHAAVSESVELMRHVRKASAAGLVNAVLRKVRRDAAIEWPSPAVAAGLPEWLYAKWIRDFGAERTAAVAEAAMRAPEMFVRVPPGRESEAQGELAELPGCYRVSTPGPFRIQDIGSQWVVSVLGVTAGDTFLDVCSAPGNKTAQALESQPRLAVASDVSPARLAGLAGLNCHRVVLDGTRRLPFGAVFDRILLDAPCSGTGTLGRNPEIRWRLQPHDLGRHAFRQARLLGNALEVLASPGGRLVYSTCSLEREENEAVVESVLAGKTARVVNMLRRFPGADPGDGFFAAVIES